MITSVYPDSSAHATSRLFTHTEKKSRIPFSFSAMPHRLSDDDTIASLDGGATKVLIVISRHVNLTSQTTVGERTLLTGWSIPISQEKIGKKAGLKRPTVNRKIKILVEKGIIEVRKPRYGCCQYRLVDYDVGPEDLAPETEPVTNPAVPTPEQVEEFAQEDAQTQENQGCAGSDTGGVTPAAHTKESLREYKEKPLSGASTAGEGQPEKDDWKAFEKYAIAFHGEIRSQKLLREASVYFQKKVEEYGVAPDGVDRVMEMIPKIKQLGAKTHHAFDTGYGAEAWNIVKEREDLRLKRQEHKARTKADSSPTNPESIDSVTTQEATTDNASPSRSDISSAPPAREQVATWLYARNCLVNVGIGDPFTNHEIEERWQRAYRDFGAPTTTDEWVRDRIEVRNKLTEKGITTPYTEQEIDQLRIDAHEHFRPPEINKT